MNIPKTNVTVPKLGTQRGFASPLCDRNRSNSTMNTLTHSVASRVPSSGQHGFISLPLTWWVIIGLVAALALSMLAVKVQTSRLDSVKAEFVTFKEGVKRVGEEQERKTKETIKQQEAKSRATIKSLESRLSNTRREFDRLRGSPGRGELPPVPSASATTDDATRDSRLLDLLQHAEEQAARLAELQEWVRAQAGR